MANPTREKMIQTLFSVEAGDYNSMDPGNPYQTLLRDIVTVADQRDALLAATEKVLTVEDPNLDDLRTAAVLCKEK